VKPKKFEPFEHTADIGLVVYGLTLKTLFKNSASGMFSFLADLSSITPDKKVFIEVRGIDYESLLINFLNEMLFQFNTKKIIFSEFNIKQFKKYYLKAEISGCRLSELKTGPHYEIKAATYHNLKISRLKNSFETRILFDI